MPAMALPASAASREPERKASSGTATSQTAAGDETPPEVAAMQTMSPASEAEEIACASAETAAVREHDCRRDGQHEADHGRVFGQRRHAAQKR